MHDCMKVALFRYLVLVGGAVFALSASADTAYTATQDGDALIHCMCAAAKPGCAIKFFDTVSGSERLAWTQRASLLAGHTYNFDEMCYRKRTEPGLGNGVCCEALDEKGSIERLFRGTIQP
jgi:hypothetical protein